MGRSCIGYLSVVPQYLLESVLRGEDVVESSGCALFVLLPKSFNYCGVLSVVQVGWWNRGPCGSSLRETLIRLIICPAKWTLVEALLIDLVPLSWLEYSFVKVFVGEYIRMVVKIQNRTPANMEGFTFVLLRRWLLFPPGREQICLGRWSSDRKHLLWWRVSSWEHLVLRKGTKLISNRSWLKFWVELVVKHLKLRLFIGLLLLSIFVWLQFLAKLVLVFLDSSLLFLHIHAEWVRTVDRGFPFAKWRRPIGWHSLRPFNCVPVVLNFFF